MRTPTTRALALALLPVLALSMAGCAKKGGGKDLPYVARDVGTLHPASVLLAPGTASFDQFRSFEERGDRFAALARRLA